MSAKSILDSTPSKFPSETQKPPKGGERGHRLPSDWRLDADLIAYALEHGYSEHEAEFINHRFVNHWAAATGRSARKQDWRRTFQNWITNEKRWLVREGAAAWKRAASAGEIDWSEWISKWRGDPEAWHSQLGPKPDEPGYRGPPLSEPDLFASGAAAR